MQQYDSYKPSGVQWLGEIPSHWEVIKSKYLWKESFSISENGNEELLSVSQYDGITPAKGDSRSESLKGYKIVSENDIVINIMLAWMGGLGVSNPYNKENLVWLGGVIRASNLNQYSQSVAQPGLAVSMIQNNSYPYPPEKERERIASFLKNHLSQIDMAIANCQNQISLLQERKQIIINEVVMGKVKVG